MDDEILDAHPAAELFPMLSRDRLGELADDIKANGLREPITLCDGLILDGRNRAEACRIAGVEPRYRQFDGGDPFAWVWSLNGQRRDLTADQRAAIWLECNEQSAAWQARQQKIRDDGNRKRSDAASSGSSCPTTPREHVTRAAAASASGTNAGAIKRQQQLRNNRPDLAEQVRNGTIKPMQAMRELKRDQLAGKVAALPDGTYRVIYADPPWKYGDERVGLADYSESAAAAQYPTMPTSDICALDVKSLSADDAVLFMWATFPLLPDALDVVKAWGFAYKTAFVWHKLRANMGNYHNASAELLIVATRGSCAPECDTRFGQVQEHMRVGRHSEKPDLFRKMIDEMYPSGPRIELFRRGAEIEGWSAWGNEAHVIDLDG